MAPLRQGSFSWLALALFLACVPATAKEDDGNDAGVFAKIDLAVQEGMERLGLEAADVRPRHDFVPADRWRLPLIDRYLDRPLETGRAAYECLRPWVGAEESLTSSLARAFTTLGWTVDAPEAPPSEDGLYEALAALYSRTDEDDPPSKAAFRKAIRPVPSKARPLLRAVKEAIDLREQAFADLSEEDWVQLRKFGSQFNTGARRSPLRGSSIGSPSSKTPCGAAEGNARST